MSARVQQISLFVSICLDVLLNNLFVEFVVIQAVFAIDALDIDLKALLSSILGFVILASNLVAFVLLFVKVLEMFLSIIELIG